MASYSGGRDGCADYVKASVKFLGLWFFSIITIAVFIAGFNKNCLPFKKMPSFGARNRLADFTHCWAEARAATGDTHGQACKYRSILSGGACLETI